MAHKKAGGSSNNGRDSAGRFALTEGRVEFVKKRNDRMFVSVAPLAKAAE